MKLKLLHALPTWILTSIFTCFLPESNPLSGERFSLDDWHDGRTEVCRHFDNMFWVFIIGAFFLVLNLMR